MIIKQLSDILNNSNLCIKLEFDKEAKELYHNYSEYLLLIDEKNKINDYSKEWEKYKKMSNDYELIYLANRNLKNESIADYEPLSRSYFKMWEILYNFDFTKGMNDISYAALAEGPGGFIEAVNNYTKSLNIKTDIYGITLNSTNKDIPGWKKANEYILNNPNIKICYGEDGTGNLYKIENIRNFSQFIGKKVDIVSGDAGFDFSNDFDNQEKQSSQIIFCEIVTALYIQKVGGTFICKLFDTYTNISIQFINLLSFFYEELYFVKPNTSRPANSEKYIICRGFNGIDTKIMNKLFILVKNWEIIEDINSNINKILENTIEIELLNNIINFNTTMCNIQINNIKKTLTIIKNKNRLETLSGIIVHQTKSAIEWCKKYNIPINNNSNFLV
jgi:23S rRNA U2552 (ribose-2'-O)-methylase RlmE/FtsJ